MLDVSEPSIGMDPTCRVASHLSPESTVVEQLLPDSTLLVLVYSSW